MFQREDPVSKRQLGVVTSIIGAVGIAAVLSIDLLQISQQSGIGPRQGFALFIMVLILIVGLTLIPLGDAPA